VIKITPSIKPVYGFNPDATYIISGGLGGIGRSLARWMVDHSAKNLILLSRSRTHSKAAVALLKELREKGINVSTPACDVADESALKNALQQCSDMPPIKGCIQASMVLKVNASSSSPISSKH
jgi:short-subunit dehydrogenase